MNSTLLEPDGPVFDPTLDGWVDYDLDGNLVYGLSRAECLTNRSEANENVASHQEKNPLSSKREVA